MRHQLRLRQEILIQHLCHAPWARFREHRERETGLVRRLLTGMPIGQRELLGGIVVQTWALLGQLGDRVPRLAIACRAWRMLLRRIGPARARCVGCVSHLSRWMSSRSS
jgi:hypothetical protein